MDKLTIKGQSFDVAEGIVQITPDQLEDLLDVMAFDAAMQDDDELIDGEFSKKLALSDESRLKLWRGYRKLSQSELGDLAGCSQAYIADIERGKKDGSIKIMKEIAAALRVDIDDLV